MLLLVMFCLTRAQPISVKVPTSATLDVRLHRTKLLFCLKNSCFGSNFSWNCEGHKTNRLDFFYFRSSFVKKNIGHWKKLVLEQVTSFSEWLEVESVSQENRTYEGRSIQVQVSSFSRSLPVEWTNFWMSVRLSWSSHRLAKALTFLKKVR